MLYSIAIAFNTSRNVKNTIIKLECSFGCHYSYIYRSWIISWEFVTTLQLSSVFVQFVVYNSALIVYATIAQSSELNGKLYFVFFHQKLQKKEQVLTQQNQLLQEKDLLIQSLNQDLQHAQQQVLQCTAIFKWLMCSLFKTHRNLSYLSLLNYNHVLPSLCAIHGRQHTQFDVRDCVEMQVKFV